MSKKRTQTKSSVRQASQARQRKQRQTTTLIWAGVGVGVLVIIGFLIWQQYSPRTGEDIPIPAGYQTHIPEGTPPGPYPSDPPAGGVHYDAPLDAGFYQ